MIRRNYTLQLLSRPILSVRFFFFFTDTATTEIYTLSLHDALPISRRASPRRYPGSSGASAGDPRRCTRPRVAGGDRKSTRLNSSHVEISYAVFCLKKKKKNYSIEHIGKSCAQALS